MRNIKKERSYDGIKETLLMPKTDFPMRGNLPNREPQIEQKWYDENVYQRVLDKNKDKRLSFYMMDLHMLMEIFIWDMH